MNKDELRSQMRRMRRALSAEAQREAEEAVFARVSALSVYRRARTVMAYAAARGELPLGRVFADVLAAGKTLVLPRCACEGVMHGHRVDAPDRLVKGAYGILEPKEAEAYQDEANALCLVPGLAFSADGARLGYGKGYYDTFFARHPVLKLGLCYDFQLVPQVPTQPHDVRMDGVLTDKRLVLTADEERME